MKKGYIIAFLIIALASGFTMWAFSTGTSVYVNLKEARLSKTPVQLRGIILHEDQRQPRYDLTSNTLRFWLKDRNDEVIEVVYHGGKPDSFDTASGTAARGVLGRDEKGKEVFLSDSLMLQCDTKYSDKPAGNKPAGSLPLQNYGNTK